MMVILPTPPLRSICREAEMQASRSASTHGLCFFFLVFLVLCVERSSAQAATDPTEEKALNAIFGKWGLTETVRWNTTGDPCSGVAVDTTNFDDVSYNPAIKCDCSFKNNTICHITKLKVYAMDVVGSIPDELQNLTYLENLNLAQNYLTGSFPGFIGNFTKMQYLSFGINAFSGTIPKELGNLRKLISLAMGTNKFNGSLPPELGNLINLQQWYMDSCGASGDFPSTLSNLKSMQILWASDNNFAGTIPDFIGSWTNLTTLTFKLEKRLIVVLREDLWFFPGSGQAFVANQSC